jgi:PKHD-type hydroxylase
MFHIIKDVLNASELKVAYAELQELQFDDGKITAGWSARQVKNNIQAKDFSRSLTAKTILGNLQKNENFRLFAAPLRFSTFMLSKYEVGMEYGYHSDDPMMEAGRVRTDLAFTLFLSDPSTYDGGELEIELAGQSGRANDTKYKLAAGSMVIYPATFGHRVTPVLEGKRLAVIGWVQSMIRDHQKRAIISELSVAREVLFRNTGKGEAFDGLSNALSNLVRMWAEN